MTKLRLCVALLVLVMLTSACSSPTGPSPVVTAPGPIVEAPPSQAQVGSIRRFGLDPYRGPNLGGVGAYFTRTTSPLHVFIFPEADRNYQLRITIEAREPGMLALFPANILADVEVSFSGRSFEVAIPYDSSRCFYRDLATGEVKCSVSLRNLDPNNEVWGIARFEGVPIR